MEFIKYISYDMGLQEVKCGDDEETDKFQYMSEFGLMNKLDDKDKEADPGRGEANGGGCSFHGAD